LSGLTVRHDNEDPGCTGSIAINIAGGLPTYTVSWNSPNSGSQIINICEGTFIPTVIDGNGCRKSFDGIVVNTFGVKGLVKNANCPSESTGGVQLQVAGGDAPFKYSWLNARGDTVARVKDLGNVPAGVYRSIVKEKSGNTLERQFTVGTTSNLSATVDVLSNFNGFAVSCPNGRDASAKIVAINGGGSNYTYEWLRNDTLIASNQTIQNARGGKYKIRVTDGLGCAIEKEVLLSMPPGLILDAFISNPSCQGSRDAEIVANVGGGIQGSIYTYRWSNQSTNPRISFLSQGSYSVTVTDRNKCTTAGTFSVKDPAPIQVTMETINATENCNGRARALVKGGTKPYTFRWNAPVKTADSIAINLCPGDYVVAVTDAKGCKAAPEITMSQVLDRRYPCLDMRAVISPDGDGLNEAFLINCIEEFSENVVKIYNRWGQQVYVSKNYNNDWKGISSSGETLPDGAYYYVLEYKDNTSGQRVQLKGSITLIRN
jgi:gliding motility-associated-like protein